MKENRGIAMKIVWMLLTLIATSFVSVAQEETKRFAASPGGNLILDLRVGGGVTVTGWDRNEIQVTYLLRDQFVEVEFNEIGNGLEISARLASGEYHSIRAPEFEVQVPRLFNVELDSMGGGLHVIDVEGEFSGRTMGGELIFENVRGEASISTMGGEIRVTDSELDGSLSTMGGEVLFRNVVGDVKGSSMGGNVRYQNVRRRDGSVTGPKGVSEADASPDTVQISTMGGEIEIDDAPEGAAVSTMGGDIHISNASRFVRAKTMGGDIRVDAVNGWIKATTMSGDIEVHVTGAGGNVELDSMSGDIVLYVPAGFSMSLDLEISYTRNSRKDYRISSDFPLKEQRSADWDRNRWGGRKLITAKAEFGGGKNRVRIKTVNGNIDIRKAR